MFVLTPLLDKAIKLLKQVPDGDFVDRLNYYWTSAILSLLAYSLFGWSFYGENIECWFPAIFSTNWQQYALDICFVQGTYYVPFFDKNLSSLGVKQMQPVPLDPKVQDESSISYYQWAPIIICLQAAAFYAPVVIWRKLYENGDIPVQDICKMNWYKTTEDNKEERAKQLEMVARLIARNDVKGCSMFRGNYLFLSYLFIKFLFILNSLAQFLFLMKMFGASDSMWGWEMTKDILRGIDPEESLNFPRVTICQFTIRMLGEPVTDHRVQCALVINFIYEKIFLLQWYYLALNGTINLASFLWWTLSSFSSQTCSGRSDYQRFEENYLRLDGMFILRLLTINHGEMVARDLKKYLWKDFAAMGDTNTTEGICLKPIVKIPERSAPEFTV